MFECKYKYELQDSIVCAKYIYKSQKRKQDKIIAILIPILMVAVIAMLVYDIIAKKSFVWDIVLLVALLILEGLYIAMPLILVNSQKKAFKRQKLDEMDYLHIKVDNNICVETMYKNETEVAKDVHNLKALTSYLEDNARIILVFNNVEFVCVRKEFFVGDIKKFKEHLQKSMAKNSNKK